MVRMEVLVLCSSIMRLLSSSIDAIRIHVCFTTTIKHVLVYSSTTTIEHVLGRGGSVKAGNAYYYRTCSSMFYYYYRTCSREDVCIASYMYL